jgi:hypothetical protein
MAWARHGHGMASVNQTRPHCVNQIGKTHSKPLAERHGRVTTWAQHTMCESASTGHELSGAAVTKGRQIGAGSNTSSTAGRYRCYMLLFVTTTNRTVDRSYTKREESSVSFFLGPQKNAVKICLALVLVYRLTPQMKTRRTFYALCLFSYAVSVSNRAEPCDRLGLGPLACWDCGFESRQRHACLSLVIVVCCQVAVSATG